MAHHSPTRHWHSLLLLGRVSNLPTVWSNCLAGSLLGGGGRVLTFLALCVGATFLYVGGMFLNDAFDANFDAQHRPERPIPSGAIRRGTVWKYGFAFLTTGLAIVAALGWEPAIFGVLLVGFILLYNAVHKVFPFAPFLMACCRVWLLLMAASTALLGVSGLTVWSSVVLGAYVVGLSYLAQRESVKGPLRYWPLIFLLAPAILAIIVNRGPYLGIGLTLTSLLLGWIIWCLRNTYWAPQRNVGRSVAGLLAGMVLVDTLAVTPGIQVSIFVFAFLFILALLFQRFVPAT